METLKAIEGAYGSAVMLTFAFLRWVFFLNIVLAAIWMGIVIIPFWVKPPPSFSWDDFWKPGFNAVVQVCVSQFFLDLLEEFARMWHQILSCMVSHIDCTFYRRNL